MRENLVLGNWMNAGDTTEAESMPGVGPVKAQKIMDRLAISSTRRLRGLGEKQKQSLIREFTAK